MSDGGYLMCGKGMEAEARLAGVVLHQVHNAGGTRGPGSLATQVRVMLPMPSSTFHPLRL